MVQRFIRGIIVPALAIAVWEAASWTGILKLEFLSRPSDILAAGIDGLRDGSILLATAQTFEAAALGLAIAVVAGVLAGTILGLSRPIERTVGPTIEALRPIPAVAFIPLTLLLFGFGLSDGRHSSRLCLRLADPDCNSGRRAGHRAPPP